MTIREMLAERGIKVATLAEEIGESYGNVYTIIKMDDAGQETKHKSAIARRQKILEHLGLHDSNTERVTSAIFKDSDPATAEAFRARMERNYAAQIEKRRGWTFEFDTDLDLADLGIDLHCGDRIKFRDYSGEVVLARFICRITNAQGKTWVDVAIPQVKDGPSGGFRSVNEDRLV